MSGHSKWSSIKHKKAVVDAKRGKEFGKLAHLITVESRLAGGDPSTPSLKAVIDKAKAANMPKDNIERAIQKGVGGDGGTMDAITYELYGPAGVAILVDTLTDNRNRTVQELKHLVATLGYQLAEPGAASWAFEKEGGEMKATTTTSVTGEDEEKLSSLIDAIEEHTDVQQVYTNAA